MTIVVSTGTGQIRALGVTRKHLGAGQIIQDPSAPNFIEVTVNEDTSQQMSSAGAVEFETATALNVSAATEQTAGYVTDAEAAVSFTVTDTIGASLDRQGNVAFSATHSSIETATFEVEGAVLAAVILADSAVAAVALEGLASFDAAHLFSATMAGAISGTTVSDVSHLLVAAGGIGFDLGAGFSFTASSAFQGEIPFVSVPLDRIVSVGRKNATITPDRPPLKGE